MKIQHLSYVKLACVAAAAAAAAKLAIYNKGQGVEIKAEPPKKNYKLSLIKKFQKLL